MISRSDNHTTVGIISRQLSHLRHNYICHESQTSINTGRAQMINNNNIMRTDGGRLKVKSECFAINRLLLLEHEYHSALGDLENDYISFNVFFDVCMPITLLIIIVIWGYQLNAMTADSESGENHTMLLVYGIGLIVISGTACVYIAIRMTAMRPAKVTTTFLPAEVRPLYTKEKRSQKFYYQTIPEIHRNGKKLTDIFIV